MTSGKPWWQQEPAPGARVDKLPSPGSRVPGNRAKYNEYMRGYMREYRKNNPRIREQNIQANERYEERLKAQYNTDSVWRAKSLRRAEIKREKRGHDTKA